MKIPMKWLREYVDVNMAPQEYASRMIMTGTAVEGVDKTGEQFDGVVVGRVLGARGGLAHNGAQAESYERSKLYDPSFATGYRKASS